MINLVIINCLLNYRYDTQWYRIPIRQQKLILFILHRSMHSCKLITGGTFVFSLEGFASVIENHCEIFTFNRTESISEQFGSQRPLLFFRQI